MASQSTGSESDRLILPGLVVTPDWLLAQLGHPDLQIVDLRVPELYAQGHLPGAISLEPRQLVYQREGVDGILLPTLEFAAAMEALGISSHKPIVLYDDNHGMPSARVLWALARYGHTQVALLTGGWPRWHAESFPSTRSAPTLQSSTFDIAPNDDAIAELSWLQENLGTSALTVIDTRSAIEYAAGHLPGAIHWDWVTGTAPDSWDAFRGLDEVRMELEELGVTPDKETVTYCRSGVRAAHTYVLLRCLGYPRVRNYDGSWLEWSQLVM